MSGLVNQSADARSKTIGSNLRCRALVRFNATDGTIYFKDGVSGVTDNGQGDFLVTFTNAMPDIDFIASYNCAYNTNNYNDDHIINPKERWNNRTARQVRLTISLNTNGGNYTDQADMERYDVAIFR